MVETNKNLIQAVKAIPNLARKEGWVFTLDREDNTLFYSPEFIPDNTKLFQVTDEYAVYLDERNQPKGMMIEYYTHNFLEHHPEFKKLSKDILDDYKNKELIQTVDPSSDSSGEVSAFQALLERTLILEAIEKPLHG